MAVPEIRPRVRRQVVIGEASSDVDCHRRIGNAVIETGCVWVAVEVDSVLFEEVRPHDHAHVRERQEEFVVFVNGHHRRRYISIHDAYVHDRPRVHVTRERMAWVSCLGVRNETHGTVYCETRCSVRVVGGIKDIGGLCSRQSLRDVI